VPEYLHELASTRRLMAALESWPRGASPVWGSAHVGSAHESVQATSSDAAVQIRGLGTLCAEDAPGKSGCSRMWPRRFERQSRTISMRSPRLLWPMAGRGDRRFAQRTGPLLDSLEPWACLLSAAKRAGDRWQDGQRILVRTWREIAARPMGLLRKNSRLRYSTCRGGCTVHRAGQNPRGWMFRPSVLGAAAGRLGRDVCHVCRNRPVISVAGAQTPVQRGHGHGGPVSVVPTTTSNRFAAPVALPPVRPTKCGFIGRIDIHQKISHILRPSTWSPPVEATYAQHARGGPLISALRPWLRIWFVRVEVTLHGRTATSKTAEHCRRGIMFSHRHVSI